MGEVKEIYFKNRKEWRDWLEKNFNKEKSIWLVHDKFKNGEMSYDDIVEESLCFGWIDSTVKSRSDERSMIYMSVRKPKSIWAASNKIRVGKLIKDGSMTPAGLKVIEEAKKDGSWSQYDVVENLIKPEELEIALKKNKKAEEFFESLSKSMKKQILYHIYSAKQTETREVRAEKLVESLNQNKKPF